MRVVQGVQTDEALGLFLVLVHKMEAAPTPAVLTLGKH